jgi:hypothetical protein
MITALGYRPVAVGQWLKHWSLELTDIHLKVQPCLKLPYYFRLIDKIIDLGNTNGKKDRQADERIYKQTGANRWKERWTEKNTNRSLQR